MDLFGIFGESLGYEPRELNAYSPLALAYIGDGIYEIVIRSMVVGRGSCSPNKLHKETSSWVKASAQCEMLDAVFTMLTEEEKDYFRRGRNAKPGSMAKHASMWEYRRATGYETLMGYLYVSGQTERMLALIKAGAESRKKKEEAEKAGCVFGE